VCSEIHMMSGTSTFGNDKVVDKFSEANWYDQTKKYRTYMAKIGLKTWVQILEGAHDTKNARQTKMPVAQDDECAQISDLE
jgi:hypothetical protein